jgi:hypothetical protein
MSEHDISLVTSQAGSIIGQGLQVSLGSSGGGSSPSTLVAMAGMAQGGALQIHPNVTTAMNKMSTQISSLRSTSPLDANYASNLAQANTIEEARNNLGNQTNKLWASGPGGFGQILQQAHGHCLDSIELTQTTNFINKVDFNQMGTGITSPSSLSTMGMDKVMGNLPNTGAVMQAAGSCYNTQNMSTFGTGAGLIDKLNSQKLGNATGVNAALVKNGVDTNRLTDPVYKNSIDNALSGIKDPDVIKSVVDQLGVSPQGSLNSLNDLTDINKTVPASVRAGVTTDLAGIGSKFSDMGASFKTPADASTMLNNIQIPSVPKLDAAAPTLPALMGGTVNVQSLTGTGRGPGGLPCIKDFTHSVSSGPEIDAIAGGDLSTSAMGNLNTAVNKSYDLMAKAGIDLTVAPTNSLSSIKGFSNNLHRMGADTSGTGLQDVLNGMATNDVYGDAVVNSLIEGKNKALMSANGIKTPSFNPNPPNLNTGIPISTNKLLGL